MRYLILGGTGWLSGEAAAAALAAGHEVTCLARGTSGGPPDGAALVRADRDRPDAYEGVAGEEWDVVVDIASQPGRVRRAVAALRERSRRFVYVSSISVYADSATPGQDEGAPLLPALDGDVMESVETYGQAKVACERRVLEGFGPDRSIIVRAGLIAGPGDRSGRTGYWPLRLARPAAADGTVLVPDSPELMTQMVDVRDLAAWMVDAGARDVSGIFNSTGQPIAWPRHLAAARTVAGHTGPLAEVGQEWLREQGVTPWMGDRSLPLWLPLPEFAGFGSHDVAAALAAGLASRPLEDTLADVLKWELAEGADRPRRAGLTPDEERTLLATLNGERA